MDEASIQREEASLTTARSLFISPRSEIWWIVLAALVLFEIALIFVAFDMIEREILYDDNYYFARTRFPIPVPGWGLFVIVLIVILTTFPIACFGPARWIYRKLPNLILTGEGIRFNTLNEAHYWSWSDVGSFRLSIKAGRRPQYWAYASFQADQTTATAPTSGGGRATEVTIYLNFLKCGGNEEKARRLVALLNEWRDRFQGHHRQDADCRTVGH